MRLCKAFALYVDQQKWSRNGGLITMRTILIIESTTIFNIYYIKNMYWYGKCISVMAWCATNADKFSALVVIVLYYFIA